MGMRGNIATLKERFEQLFPGKWLLPERNQRNLQTGLATIDSGLSRGLARKRVTEWVGATSSGKTTVLRAVIANWCAAGLHVVYVDAMNKLIPADWAFVEQGQVDGALSPMVRIQQNKQAPALVQEPPVSGKFWVVRNLVDNNQRHKQNALWATEQLIRCNLFDVVVLDATDSLPLESRFYARLQRSLDTSKAALLVVKDKSPDDDKSDNSIAGVSWGAHARLHFQWSTPILCQPGLNGMVAITPTIRGFIYQDGLTNNLEVAINSYAANRLFTHSQVPDRRAPKARADFKK